MLIYHRHWVPKTAGVMRCQVLPLFMRSERMGLSDTYPGSRRVSSMAVDHCTEMPGSKVGELTSRIDYFPKGLRSSSSGNGW